MNFIKPNWKVVVGVTCACIIAFFACIVIVSYIFLFYCKKTMDDYAIFFNDYNAQSKNVIDKYGDFKITRAYVVTTPITSFTLGLLNTITLQNCKQILDDTMHAQLLIECKSSKREKKMLMIDKTNCINVLTDFHIDDTCRIIPIRIKKKITLREILDETCARIGEIKFFNWHIYKNNCYYFTKELINQINPEFSCKYFKSKKKTKQFYNKLFYNNFILHSYHVVMFLYNFFQKYVINVKQHIVSKLEHTMKIFIQGCKLI